MPLRGDVVIEAALMVVTTSVEIDRTPRLDRQIKGTRLDGHSGPTMKALRTGRWLQHPKRWRGSARPLCLRGSPASIVTTPAQSTDLEAKEEAVGG